MKVVLIGASGQLGSALVRLAPPGFVVAAPARAQLDLADPRTIAPLLERVRPDVIVNAAAYTHVDDAECEPELAQLVNAAGPKRLAEAADGLGARLLQVSTDFVFGGIRAVPCAINDETSPLSVYGISKLAGEKAVIEILDRRAVVLRTAWLYARNGRNFVRTMLELMASQESIRVVYDQIGSPTWADSVARAIWTILALPDVHGVHHWCDDGGASWYDFAVAVQEEAVARELLRHSIPIRPVRTSEFPTRATRPAYSVLDKQHTATALGIEPVHWRTNLRLMLDDLKRP